MELRHSFERLYGANAYILGPANEQVTELTVDPSGNTTWKHTNVYAAGQLIATYDATPSGMQAG